jgi:hypothetical protein
MVSFRSLERAVVAVSKGRRSVKWHYDLFFVIILIGLGVWNVHKVGDHGLRAHVKCMFLLLGILRDQTLVEGVQLSICSAFHPFVGNSIAIVVLALLELNLALLNGRGDDVFGLLLVILRALNLDRVEDGGVYCEFALTLLFVHRLDPELCRCLRAFKWQLFATSNCTVDII